MYILVFLLEIFPCDPDQKRQSRLSLEDQLTLLASISLSIVMVFRFFLGSGEGAMIH